MELKLWPEGLGLPSSDVQSLITLLYAKISKNKDIRLVFCDGQNFPPSELLPQLVVGEDDTTERRATNIINRLRKMHCNIDQHLSRENIARSLAIVNFVETTLVPAIEYCRWFDNDFYTSSTRPWHSHSLFFPHSITVPRALRHRASLLVNGRSRDEIVLSARKCLRSLDALLNGSSPIFLFDEKPCTADVFVAACVAALRDLPLLRAELDAHPSLTTHASCTFSEAGLTWPKDAVAPQPPSVPWSVPKVDANSMFVVAVVTAMVGYAAYIGLPSRIREVF
jgi:hypothetical protein